MAITNHERVGKAMELLKQGLVLSSSASSRALTRIKPLTEATRYLGEDRLISQEGRSPNGMRPAC